MKNKIIKILPCLAILILFTIVQFMNLNISYQKLLDTSGLLPPAINQKGSGEENADDIQKTELGENKGEASKDKKLKLHSLAALLMDASNHRVLYEENGYKELPMASTTKIMTCIVALENSRPDEVVTVSSYAARMPDVQLNIREGEQFYMKDLLYSLMLESHNDVAVAIAEHVGGTVEGFATMMNKKAKELGCEHTNFVTPNGLDAEGHHTTARDLAAIACYAVNNTKFVEITNTASHEFKEITKGKSFHVSNKDRFLSMMDGAIGVKTGFTNDAGYCFVGAVRREDRTLVSVVLGCGWPPHKSLKWNDTKALMTYGIKNYQVVQIFRDTKLKPIYVDNGQQRFENLDVKGDLSLLMREDEKVSVSFDIPKVLTAPVKAGSIVGYAKYYIDDSYYTRIPIHALTDIAKINYRYCLKKLFLYWSLQY